MNHHYSDDGYVGIGDLMNVYGIDYLDSSDGEIKYMVIDAHKLDEAREKAHELLKSYGIPKRNIINLEELTWLK